MKKTILMLSVVSFLFWVGIACHEEPRGPFVTDSTPPGKVSNPQVKYLPGGVQIIYEIPTDDDLLYVEGRYQRNGKQVVSRSSVYKDTLLVEGLNSTEPQEVELVAVDRSQNESAVERVTINPEKSPLIQMFESFEMVPDFGGAKLNYKNTSQIKVELLLYLLEGDKKTYNQSVFLQGQETRSSHTFRDTAFVKKPVKFALEAKDRWGNTTEQYESGEIKALEEYLMDRKKMKAINLTGDDKPGWGWVKSRVIDGNTKEPSGFHSASAGSVASPVVPPYTEPLSMITIDMGVLANLSRLKWWQRTAYNWHYSRGNPRYFEIWGTDKFPDDRGASMETGWILLVKDGEIKRPSGKTTAGNPTATEIAIADKGFEFLIDTDGKPVRYIRFVCKENWSGSKYMNIMEMKMWGKVVEEAK